MGGGDLNMKKSWHPLLIKNQERVWLEEKKALEEKKKLDQLRKEKEEERQLQELQRLQEEQTGKKRQEKLEWMYSTPATGSGQNANDLEDYLLGKKRVDRILTADENEKVGAAHKNFIATQFANSARDTAAKIREDPLLAIKQQEQSAYQALMSNPLRLRQMQEKNGIKPKKDKKEKKEKKHKDKGKRRADSRSRSRERDSSRRSPSPARDRYSRSRRSVSPDARRSRSTSRSPPSRSPPSRSYDDRRGRNDDHSRRSYSHSRHATDRNIRPAERTWPKSDDSDDNARAPDPSPRRSYNDDERKRRRSPSPRRRYDPPVKRSRMSPPPPRQPSSSNQAADDRAARLAAMSSNANSMSSERQERLKTLLEQEKLEVEAEQRAREKSRGMSGYLNQEQKRMMGSGGLEDRIKRGRQGLLSERD